MAIALRFHPLNHLIALIAAVALAFGVATPRAAKADPGEAIAAGIIGLALYCGATGKCTNDSSRGGGSRGPADAVALTRTEKMWVQGGLQTLGFYTGAIDGSIGGGTRAAIRVYQGAIGEAQTGVMTGKQINDLAALSPGFVHLDPTDRSLFNADLAGDLSRDEVRALQAALNAKGFAAGVVDGSPGGQTRNAITAYKAAQGLPGKPVPSRRLLAHLNGWAPPQPAGAQLIAGRANTAPAAPMNTVANTGIANAAAPASAAGATVIAQPPAKQAPAPAAVAVAPVATDLTFDILGVSPGMSEAAVKTTLMAQLGTDVLFDTAGAAAFGGSGAATHALQAVQPAWPAPPAEQVVALFDEARPEAGALAVFRLIQMPESVTQEVFDTQVLPDIVANYGSAGKVGPASWIAEAGADPARCGDLRVGGITDAGSAETALWGAGGGVSFAPGAFAGLDADCGQVLRVAYEDAVIRIGLWDTGALAGVVPAPKIKF